MKTVTNVFGFVAYFGCTPYRTTWTIPYRYILVPIIGSIKSEEVFF